MQPIPLHKEENEIKHYHSAILWWELLAMSCRSILYIQASQCSSMQKCFTKLRFKNVLKFEITYDFVWSTTVYHIQEVTKQRVKKSLKYLNNLVIGIVSPLRNTISLYCRYISFMTVVKELPSSIDNLTVASAGLLRNIFSTVTNHLYQSTPTYLQQESCQYWQAWSASLEKKFTRLVFNFTKPKQYARCRLL